MICASDFIIIGPSVIKRSDALLLCLVNIIKLFFFRFIALLGAHLIDYFGMCDRKTCSHHKICITMCVVVNMFTRLLLYLSRISMFDT